MTKLFEIIQEKTKLSDSFALAMIYSIGHVLIAMTVVRVMTGASFWESGLVALIEPSINAVWLYLLHRTWVKFNK
tara:strand:- start:2004 stop:2228 length:225 start_codon:yes stop_codon:yes gene_type:complete